MLQVEKKQQQKKKRSLLSLFPTTMHHVVGNSDCIIFKILCDFCSLCEKKRLIRNDEEDSFSLAIFFLFLFFVAPDNQTVSFLLQLSFLRSLDSMASGRCRRWGRQQTKKGNGKSKNGRRSVGRDWTSRDRKLEHHSYFNK
jgi:hypothetical protein